MEDERRHEPRYAFIASAELLEENSGSRMDSRISDLSLSGCYVDTVNPLPGGTIVQLRIFTETHSFEAPATVVYAHTHLGMGMKSRRPGKQRRSVATVAARSNRAGERGSRLEKNGSDWLIVRKICPTGRNHA